MEIGELFKIIRLKKELTQKVLYENFCSRKEISRIENGKINPSIYTFIHICDVLDISYSTIIDIWQNSFEVVQLFNKIRVDITKCDFNLFCIDFLSLKSIKINSFNNHFYIEYNLFCILYEFEKNNYHSAIDLLEFTISEINETKSYSEITEILIVIQNLSYLSDEKKEFDFFYCDRKKDYSNNCFIIIQVIMLLINTITNKSAKEEIVSNIQKKITESRNVFLEIVLTSVKLFLNQSTITNYYDFKNLYLKNYVILLNNFFLMPNRIKVICLYKIFLVLFYNL